MTSYRKFITSKGTDIIGGKDAQQNEKLVKSFIDKSNIIMHTAEAGSPFCVILDKPRLGDKKQAALFCAKYSRDWRRNKKDVFVHVFSGKDVYKDKKMKTGTFGVKKYKKIRVKKSDILRFEKNESH